MKIAILTWLHNENYGSILQAYALQQALRDSGYETENIDYAPTSVEKIKNLLVNRNSPKLFLEKWNAYSAKKASGSPEQLQQRAEKFDTFRRKYINLTTRFVSPDQLRETSGKYDAYICGSDQIWSPVLLNPAFYLDFLDASDRRIGYACSFGVADVEGHKVEKITGYLKKFESISVREHAGRKIVKSLIGTEVPVMPDPTLLLQRNNWSTISTEGLVPHRYIFCYFLSWNKNHWQYAEQISKKLDLPIVIVPSVKETYKVKAQVVKNAGPEDWVGLVKGADYIITDSFHGTVFSTVFNKPFTVLKRFEDSNPRSQNSRIYTFLEKYGLSERLGAETDILAKIDYERINACIEQERHDALAWLDNALKQKDKEDGIPHRNCTGCGLCSTICPQKCIKLVERPDGFIYPEVEKNRCIECGLCTKKCPETIELAQNKVRIVYAAKTKNLELIKQSTSGGVFGELARKTLQDGGAVYGAAYTACNKVEHIRIEKIGDLPKLHGSKYVQSQIDNIIIEVKRDLQNNRSVLFSGTGCQIAALKAYLSKEYELLTCVEVVCHGVPSPGLFRSYISWLSEKEGKAVTSYQFRSKCERPTGEHSIFYYQTDICRKSGYAYEDPYYGSFLKGTTLRESCYHCRYKGKQRVSDITLGDFGV